MKVPFMSFSFQSSQLNFGFLPRIVAGQGSVAGSLFLSGRSHHLVSVDKKERSLPHRSRLRACEPPADGQQGGTGDTHTEYGVIQTCFQQFDQYLTGNAFPAVSFFEQVAELLFQHDRKCILPFVSLSAAAHTRPVAYVCVVHRADREELLFLPKYLPLPKNGLSKDPGDFGLWDLCTLPCYCGSDF